MLNNFQVVNLNLQSIITVRQPTTDVEHLNTLGTRTRPSGPADPQMPDDDTPEPSKRVPTKQKNPRRGKKVLKCFCL